MKEMLKNKGIISFMVFMIGVSFFYSASLKTNSNVEMVTSEVVSSETVDSQNI